MLKLHSRTARTASTARIDHAKPGWSDVACAPTLLAHACTSAQPACASQVASTQHTLGHKPRLGNLRRNLVPCKQQPQALIAGPIQREQPAAPQIAVLLPPCARSRVSPCAPAHKQDSATAIPRQTRPHKATQCRTGICHGTAPPVHACTGRQLHAAARRRDASARTPVCCTKRTAPVSPVHCATCAVHLPSPERIRAPHARHTPGSDSLDAGGDSLRACRRSERSARLASARTGAAGGGHAPYHVSGARVQVRVSLRQVNQAQRAHLLCHSPGHVRGRCDLLRRGRAPLPQARAQQIGQRIQHRVHRRHAQAAQHLVTRLGAAPGKRRSEQRSLLLCRARRAEK